MNGENPPAR